MWFNEELSSHLINQLKFGFASLPSEFFLRMQFEFQRFSHFTSAQSFYQNSAKFSFLFPFYLLILLITAKLEFRPKYFVFIN